MFSSTWLMAGGRKTDFSLISRFVGPKNICGRPMPLQISASNPGIAANPPCFADRIGSFKRKVGVLDRDHWAHLQRVLGIVLLGLARILDGSSEPNFQIGRAHV